MKKLVVLLFSLMSFVAYSQLVDEFPTSKRFLFQPMDTTLIINVVSYHCQEYEDIMDGRIRKLVAHRYYTDSSRAITVYGAAIPFPPTMHYYQGYGYGTDQWEYVLKYYELINGCVYLMQKSGDTDDTLVVVDTAHIRMGEAMLTGNIFRVRESNLGTYNFTNDNPVLEVYFSQPHIMTEDFWLAVPAMSDGSNRHHDLFGSSNNLLFSHGVLCGGANKNQIGYPGFYSITGDGSKGYRDEPSVTGDFRWTGPFPIISSAPCMAPWHLEVESQHMRGATIGWRAQYGNDVFQLEYGSQGFAEGTGTTVGPIYAGSDYRCHQTIDSLQMDSDYTVRVRSWCGATGVLSGWSEIDFHTGVWCVIKAQVNNSDWGFVEGGGVYYRGAEINLRVLPMNGYCHFLNWSDGSSQNPRHVMVTSDSVFKAIMGCDTAGIYGPVHGERTVRMVPNPARTTVKVSSESPILQWSLVDIQGRKVDEGSASGCNVEIDLRRCRSGLYIVVIQTDEGITAKKLTVN